MPDEEKLDPAVVLYMPPATLNPDGRHEGARCGRCMMYMPDLKACTIVYVDGKKDTSVSGERGVCGLYVGGKPMKSNETHKPMPTVPRSVAGYYEGDDVPTRCGKCKYFIAEEEACQKVAGKIEANGCCNAYEKAKGQGYAYDFREHEPARMRT